MNLAELYNYAEQKNITISSWKIESQMACSLNINKKYHIIMNDRLIDGERNERIVLAHELGHCRSDRMYYMHDYCNPLYKANISKAERKATDEACRLLISLEELKKALRENDNEYAAAESLDIDVSTFHEVVEYYTRKGYILQGERNADDYS